MKRGNAGQEMEAFLQLDETGQFDFLTVLSLDSERKEALRRRENEIPGCQSGLWVEVLNTGDHVEIRCDSDSLLVKGMGLFLAGIFEEAWPEEIEKTVCLAKAFLESDRNFMLDSDRRKGLKRMADRIADTVRSNL